MAASPVLRSRWIGFTRKVVCSQTPVRTRGSGAAACRHTDRGEDRGARAHKILRSAQRRAEGTLQRPAHGRSVTAVVSILAYDAIAAMLRSSWRGGIAARAQSRP